MKKVKEPSWVVTPSFIPSISWSEKIQHAATSPSVTVGVTIDPNVD
jgi:hypothetical protein